MGLLQPRSRADQENGRESLINAQRANRANRSTPSPPPTSGMRPTHPAFFFASTPLFFSNHSIDPFFTNPETIITQP